MESFLILVKSEHAKNIVVTLSLMLLLLGCNSNAGDDNCAEVEIILPMQDSSDTCTTRNAYALALVSNSFDEGKYTNVPVINSKFKNSILLELHNTIYGLETKHSDHYTAFKHDDTLNYQVFILKRINRPQLLNLCQESVNDSTAPPRLIINGEYVCTKFSFTVFDNNKDMAKYIDTRLAKK